MNMDASNPIITNIITRPEYEARQSELQTRILSLETKLDSLANKIDSYNAAINSRIDKNEQNFQSQIIAEKEHRMLVQIKAWKFVGLQLLTILGGGVTYAVGEFLIVHHF